MKKTKTKITPEIVAMFKRVAEAQTACWDAASEIESLLDIEINTADDLTNLDSEEAVKDFLEALSDISNG